MVELSLILLWAGTLYHLRRLHRSPNNPILRCLMLIFPSLLVAVTVGRASVYLAVDELLGVSNAARFLQHAFALVALCVVQILMQYTSWGSAAEAGPAIRSRVVAAVVVLALMLTAFALASLGTEAPKDFVGRYGTQPWIVLYLLLYSSYLGVACVDVVRICHRHARQGAARPWVRASLRMIVTAGITGVVYVVCKAAFTIAAWRHVRMPWSLVEEQLSTPLVALGAILIGIGALLPPAGSIIEPCWHQLQQWRQYRAMHTLWSAISTAVPRVALQIPSPAVSQHTWTRLPYNAWREHLSDLSWQHYRRVIEIQDGLLDLRFYRQPTATPSMAASSGRRSDQQRLNLEAAEIAAAISAKRTGQPPIQATDPRPLTAGADNLDAWLADLSRTYAALPAASRSTHTLARQHQPPTPDGEQEHLGVSVETTMSDDGHADPAPRSGPDRLARLLTDLLSPAILIVVVVIPIAWHGSTTVLQAWISAALAAITGSIIPITYIIRGVRRGHWTDHHVGVREQRRRPLMVALLSGVLGVILLILTGAREMTALCVAGMSALVVAMVVTFGLRWKISIHAIVAAGCATSLMVVFGWWALLAWPVAAAIGWSRVRLSDHSTGQVIAGLVLGTLAASTVFPWLR